MLKTFIKIVTIASEIGTINSASMYPSGMIAIDGTTENERPFSVSFLYTDIPEHQNGDS